MERRNNVKNGDQKNTKWNCASFTSIFFHVMYVQKNPMRLSSVLEYTDQCHCVLLTFIQLFLCGILGPFFGEILTVSFSSIFDIFPSLRALSIHPISLT